MEETRKVSTSLGKETLTEGSIELCQMVLTSNRKKTFYWGDGELEGTLSEEDEVTVFKNDREPISKERIKTSFQKKCQVGIR